MTSDPGSTAAPGTSTPGQTQQGASGGNVASTGAGPSGTGVPASSSPAPGSTPSQGGSGATPAEPSQPGATFDNPNADEGQPQGHEATAGQSGTDEEDVQDQVDFSKPADGAVSL